ncbi:hypothetical protein Pmar_PMAR018335 [Perkinsus marinus ATCC 50983]|uniref:Uncharacterized protein n=1 Tax=Perkinsus marinus (strain ATCC 50983 / TXsc) TaxID=423536 RepID=C5LVU1_PERM5|nr:hypothetical protein Pmar_PMAR018335 [Perkinsus marinus ATCC 50983]EEQ99214.1 hypothetical protein Pmar_PMAR018335 [Perkinsus marinus ATCC 50983]|eukprot:XP_002766497.1 hypothetical protein Pmar_PMAR018335 [Perkinsus marinus ATCC 50983]
MLSRPEASSVIKLSSVDYWCQQRGLEGPIEENLTNSGKMLSRRGSGGFRLNNLRLVDEKAGSFTCCYDGNVDCRHPLLSPDKTPSTVASSPISPDTFAAAFLLRPGVRFEPVVQVRFCERPEVYSDNDDDILTGTLLSSDSDAESPMNDTSCRQGASRETTTKRLSSSSVSGWQGIVLETKCGIKDFDGHSALKEKTYSTFDDLESMANLMGVEPSKPRYARHRSETVSDLEEYVESLQQLPRQRRSWSTSLTCSLPRGRETCPLRGGAMLGDEDDSDSEENLLARMEAMGCDMDLEE